MMRETPISCPAGVNTGETVREIGRVERSERGSGLYRSVTVRPTVDFSNLEEVLVVLVPPRPATRDEGGA